LTITPAAGSALYYKIDNGSWIVRDMAVTIEVNATCVITAKCVNNYGPSSEVTCSLTVSGPAVPTFAAAQGTTIGTGNVVSRGGSIVVSVPQGGELHYSTDGVNYTTASGLSVTIPVPAAGVHIYAYNVEDGDQSSTIDNAYTIAALAAPSFSPANNTEFPATGGTVTITATNGDSIKYTTDGSDPTSSGTAITVNALTASVNVTAQVTIKAIAHDSYGDSAVTTASYTITENAFIIDTSDQSSTVTIGGVTFNLDSTTASPVSGYRNKITQSQLTTAGASITDNKTTLSFSDISKIKLFDGGAFIITNTSSLFNNATNMTSCKVNIESSGTNSKTFYSVANDGKVTASGTLEGVNNLFNPYNNNLCNLDVDISGLSSYNDAGFNGNLQGMFGRGVRSLVIGSGFKVSSSGTNPSLLFVASNSGFTTLKVVSTTPPDVTSSGLYNWLQSFGTSCTNTNKKILVPPGTLSTYTSATGWSDYASIMEEYTE